MNIYVGNLPFTVIETDLRDIFTPFGNISAIDVVTEKDTGVCKGIAFIEMPNTAEARAAIDALNDTVLKGQAIIVGESQPRPGGSGNRSR